MFATARALATTVAAAASIFLAAESARAQRLANGRPARPAQLQRERVVREVVQQPSAAEPPAAAAPEGAPPESLPVPPAVANPEAVAPADPREDATSERDVETEIEAGCETDCDDRFHLRFGQRLGLGSWCRPRFGFGALRESLPTPEPMTGASWLSRPLHVDVFSGVIYGGPLIEDNIRRQGDLFSGFRLGWDWTRRLGGEMRFGFAQVGTEDILTGVELDDADLVYWDLNVLWYPTGDTRVRPYLSLGLGALHVDFVDADGNGHQKELVGIPLAAGVKYRATPWCALRADIADNIALPYDDIEGQGNFSITVSAEFHFGGQRRSYWPWNPTLQSW